MKIKMPRSIKGKLKEMKEPILKQMSIEQDLQAELRAKIVKSKDDDDDDEIEKAKQLLDESIDHWEVLKRSLEEYEKLSKNDWKFSPDTLLVVAGNLIGILLILNFEKMDIIRSKAISFVLKGRV